MALRLEELAKTIDQLLLDPSTTVAEVDSACEDARASHLAAVCVAPYAVERAAEALRGCDVKVSTVIGHPYGMDVAKTKIVAAESAIAQGADELDVVLNVGALRSGDLRGVRDELVAMSRAVRVRSVNGGRGLVLLSVAVECDGLDARAKHIACKLAEDAGADFVSIMSGYGARPVLPDEVELVRELLPETIGVKATCPVDGASEAESLIAAGAARIGTEHALAILKSFGKAQRAS